MSENITVHRFKADNDGCAAYLVQDAVAGEAAVIDPRLDQVEEIVEHARRSQVRLVWALDTHTHADHMSGVRKLAELTGARVAVHEASRSKLPAERVREGSTLAVGGALINVIHAPGHTPDSIALHVAGHLFTGDALLVGSVGRTDFMGGSASDLFDTFAKFKALPPGTVVHPGHDYVGRPESTLAAESASNEAYRQTQREALVQLLSATKPPPANLNTILAFNLEQPAGSTLSTAELSLALRGPTRPRLLDVRTPIEYAAEHIAGSQHIPLDQLEARIDELPADAVHVLICRSGMRATTAAQLLARRGRSGRVLTGGMQAWRKAGLPIVETSAPLPIDRQVQLIVGSGVLISAILSLLVHPAFVAIAAFLGGGLAFAGATGTCGLAVVLARMPWNQLAPVTAPGSCATAAGSASTCAATPGASTCAAAPGASTCAAAPAASTCAAAPPPVATCAADAPAQTGR